MKKFLILAATAASILLAACGGGGDAPAVVTQVAVAPTSAAPEAPQTVMPTTVVPIPPPPVTYTIPMNRTSDVTLSNVPMNVKTKTVNAGQRGVNLAAFNVTFDRASQDASIQELPFRNVLGGDVGELFTNLRLVDEHGDICPWTSCYVWWTGREARVVFNNGWRPTNELKTYALQADVIPSEPNGATFSFELVGVHMRQWGKRGDELVDGQVAGKSMEVTTIVALPVITSSQGRQIMNATVGTQYEVQTITATCYSQSGCSAKEFTIYVENGHNVFHTGSGTLTQVDERTYVLHPYHGLGQGTTVTWTFFATATGTDIYAQWTDVVFEIDGVEFSPINLNPNAECIDMSQKGGGNCSFGPKG